MTPLSMKIFDLSFKVGEEEGERLTIKIVWCPKGEKRGQMKWTHWCEKIEIRYTCIETEPKIGIGVKKKNPQKIPHNPSLIIVGK